MSLGCVLRFASYEEFWVFYFFARAPFASLDWVMGKVLLKKGVVMWFFVNSTKVVS
jgi:hypothetical protein